MPKPYTYPTLYNEVLQINISKLKEWEYLKPQQIKIGTIKYAILQQLKCPEEGFEDAIKAYFMMNKDRVYKYLMDTDKKYAEDFIKLIN